MKKLLLIGAAATAFAVQADGEAWQSRAPLQDTFVNYNARDTASGGNGSIIVGNGREGCMMFDVSGLANVEAARLKLYITQCGTKEGVVWPIYVRVMRNDHWDENTLTWNLLPEEFRVAPSPVLATNDVSLAGYMEIPAGSGNSWCTIDITDAVKVAAPCGHLAIHIYTSWDGTVGDSTPLVFASANDADTTRRPVLEFQGEEEGLRLIEDAFIESSNPNSNFGTVANESSRSGAIVVEKNAREGLMKFDLSGISAASVYSAKLRVRTNNQASTGNTVQFQIIDDGWQEGTVTWNNPPLGVSPGATWSETTPGNAIRAASPGPDVFHEFELAPLVNQTLAAGKTTMSLHITIQNASPRFFICYTKDYENAEWRPHLMVTPKADSALTTRTPVQETFVGTGSGKDTAYFTWMQNQNPAWNYLQIGCNGDMAQYGFMLFDPSGLENADYVRFRVKLRNSIAKGDGVLRVAAWTTEAWNATNLTYNTLAPWFPSPVLVNAETEIPGEIASIKLTQNKGDTYFEVDATAAARAAAQAGKMITFGLFSNNGSWPEFYKGESSVPAVLIFPDPDATFGSYVHASLDRSGETPALKLTWAPGAAVGAAYTVERMEKGAWTTVATGLSAATCLDAQAKPNETHTYRIAETTSGASVTKSFDFTPEVKVLACADTFVYSGNKDSQNGTATTIVHKYEQSTSGIREGFYRFDLSEVPENFKTATLKFYSTGPDDKFSGNELFWVFTYPDFEWTDANAPSWNDVFDNEWSTPQARVNHPDSKRLAEGQVNTVGDVTSRLLGGEVFEYDVASIILAAKAKGDSHITFHTCAYDPDSQWNFGIISRERAQGGAQAAQIVFTLKNWVKRGTRIVIR